MAQKLARYVTVAGKTYGPKDDVPADVLAQIKNPKAFVPAGQAPETKDYSDRDGGTASGAQLAGPVTVGGKTYGPKDFIPDDVARQIKNPKAWKGGKAPQLGTAEADTRSVGGDQAGDGEGTDGSAVNSADNADTKTPRKSTSSTPKRS